MWSKDLGFWGFRVLGIEDLGFGDLRSEVFGFSFFGFRAKTGALHQQRNCRALVNGIVRSTLHTYGSTDLSVAA